MFDAIAAMIGDGSFARLSYDSFRLDFHLGQKTINRSLVASTQGAPCL